MGNSQPPLSQRTEPVVAAALPVMSSPSERSVPALERCGPGAGVDSPSVRAHSWYPTQRPEPNTSLRDSRQQHCTESPGPVLLPPRLGRVVVPTNCERIHLPTNANQSFRSEPCATPIEDVPRSKL